MRHSARLVVLAALLCAGGCAARAPMALADAEAAMRVKTALLNDSELGIEDVRVQVRDGVAHLRGRVSTAERGARIAALARTVSGIREVTTDFQVVPHLGAVERPLPLRERIAARRGRLIGVGAGVRFTRTTGGEVGDAVDFAPMIRLGTGRGFGPAIGFGWSTRELLETGPSSRPLANLRVRPVMLGIAYTHPIRRAQLSASLVGGWAFTHLGIDRGVAGPNRAIAVDNAFAWRPSATLWIDTTDRIAFQVSAGYLVARPRVTFASDDRVFASRVRGEALMVSVGAAWWVF